ncbi:3-isopropylmalate dehydratase small subunit [Tianweitania sp. BSSL-BM11]|uniref:3-isopropylmalate dehydratase n=1 Tax=Tianweitania aestuarii TaxID=2814886 RepID=A0ABS5RVU0_9HYPH|nr:3-isopropylmalate dehydratase small subunit [Tianweitania aestuarii]MBS9721195.1 3-isopropylmalate dehydratase small subunit [Tianweitania aestuarii]
MSEPLIHVTSQAISLPDPNVDTDIIFPARFLLKIDRDGMAECLFHDRRFDAAGVEQPAFPFNRDDRQAAKFLVAGPGFGCGSSREQAVWALTDWGIRVVIAPDFGDIFSGNAAKNGLLLIRMEASRVAELAVKAERGAMFSVDIPGRSFTVDHEEICRLDLGEETAEAFIEGWEEIDVILNREREHVAAFEAEHRARQPWLFQASEG